MRRGLKILAAVLLGLAVLLALNTVALDHQTKPASVTLRGARIIDLAGGDLQVLDEGPPNAPPVVLIHCFSCSINWWGRLIPLRTATE